MNNTMFTTGPAQPLERNFDISDYVNLDFDFDAPHESVNASSDTLLAEPLQSIGIFDPYLGYPNAFDTDYAGIRAPLSDDDSLDDNFYANQTSPEDLAKADTLQTTLGNYASLHEFAISQPMTFAQGCNSAVFEIPYLPSKMYQFPRDVSNDRSLPTPSQVMQEPSVWLPVSSQLQQHLNKVYASEIIRQLDTANPAPVLYFPAEEPYACSTSSIQSLPDNIPRPDPEITSISPSVLMRESNTLPSQHPVQIGMHNSVSPISDHTMLDLDDSGSSLIRTRAIDTSHSDNEPGTKRIKIAQAERLIGVAREMDSDRDDEPLITKKKIAKRQPLSLTREDDDSDCESENEPESESDNGRDTRSCDSGNSNFSSAPPSPILPSASVTGAGAPARPMFEQPPRQGSTWRYERAQEVRLREQRRKKWLQRRMEAFEVEGKAPNPKMQKLLKEIEDSEGFAEARDYGLEGRADGEEGLGSVGRRPVRKGARKSYVGQE